MLFAATQADHVTGSFRFHFIHFMLGYIKCVTQTQGKIGHIMHSTSLLMVPPAAIWPRMKKKLILDVDTGVDDAQAIMVALADPSVDVLGITCSHGNTPLENVLKNTLRVLKVCNRLDVSVAPRGLVGLGISHR